jgi:cytochrome c-type biogenesis protein CcmH
LLLWVSIALLTGVAILSILAPLGRRPAVAADGQARRVYLDQLAELDRELGAGRIGEAEAAATRAEIARRLIASEREQGRELPAAGESRGLRRGAALIALIAVPVVSLSLYLGLGHPGLRSQPLAPRIAAAPQTQDIEALVARVEAHLAAAPEDGRGWDVIAPVYLRLGRPQDSARAYAAAIRILGPSAQRYNGLGEALIASENGVITKDAREAFEAASAAEPSAPGPRFYLALARRQQGDTSGAIQDWTALLAEAPADAAWRPVIEEALREAEIASAPASETGEAIRALPAGEQTAMIETMVAGLAERLKSEPEDFAGWLRLSRSYAVLGRPSEAGAAAQSAVAAARNPEEKAEAEALAAELATAGETATQ